MSIPQAVHGRAVLVMHEALSHGLHGTAARLELHDGDPDRLARVALRGWLDAIALDRLERRFEDLARRGVTCLLLDLSGVQHVDYRLVPTLAAALARFEAHAGVAIVCGLSSYLRDIFRLAGCESRLRCWPSSAELIESTRELAS